MAEEKKRKGQERGLNAILIGGVLATILLAFLPLRGGATEYFPDVPNSRWFSPHVQYLAERGLLLGFPNGEYEGNEVATRYQAATLVGRMARYAEKNAPKKPSVSDVQVPEDLIFELSNKVDQGDRLSQQIKAKVEGLSNRLERVQVKSGPPAGYKDLVRRSRITMVMGASGLAFGVAALVWSLL